MKKIEKKSKKYLKKISLKVESIKIDFFWLEEQKRNIEERFLIFYQNRAIMKNFEFKSKEKEKKNSKVTFLNKFI